MRSYNIQTSYKNHCKFQQSNVCHISSCIQQRILNQLIIFLQNQNRNLDLSHSFDNPKASQYTISSLGVPLNLRLQYQKTMFSLLLVIEFLCQLHRHRNLDLIRPKLLVNHRHSLHQLVINLHHLKKGLI